jgi:hypothetical protein
VVVIADQGFWLHRSLDYLSLLLVWWFYSRRNFDFKWNFEPLPLNAVETLKGTINDGVAFSLAIRIDAAEHDSRLAVSHGRL